ncbi:MAG: hypothetical protein ABIJ37_06335 [Pseudomonadota bacterium]
MKLSIIIDRLPTYLILAIIVPTAICLYLYSTHFRAAGLFHDDGLYIVNAKSIYEGTGHEIISLPESPPNTKYPPVFPLMLSLFWQVNPSFPDNIMLMRLLSAICAVLVLPLAWSYLRLKSNYKIFLTFVFLSSVAFNHYFALFAGTILSEMPFTLFSLASIVLFLHYGRSGAKGFLYGSLLLATVAFYTRTIGVIIFFSFLLWFLRQRQLKAFLWVSAFMLLTITPWFYWSYKSAPATDSLVSAYYFSYISWLNITAQSISFDIPFIATHLAIIGLRTPLLLCGFIDLNLPSAIFAVLFWFFLLVGILNQLRKPSSVDTFYLIITIVIVTVWSPGLDTARFFFPLLPIMLFHLMDGIKSTKEDIATLPVYLKTIIRPFWLTGMTVIFMGVFIMGILRVTYTITKTSYNNEALFRSYEQSSNWIKNNTEKMDVIASNLDPLVYLLSGRKAVNVAWGNFFAILQNPEKKCYDEDDIIEALNKYKVKYLLVEYLLSNDFMNRLRTEKFFEIIKKYPAAFHKCYEKKGAFTIYKVKSHALKEGPV